MSNAERKANLPAIISSAEPKFTELVKKHRLFNFTFAREAEFALQLLKKNEYLATVACGNQDSLKDAIINIAAIGLSLNPILKQAYLIPRKFSGKMEVCLDPSYQGLIFLATSSGSILWAKAELVYEKDDFEFLGVNVPPRHKIKDIFGDRGPIVGGYVIAKMPSQDVLIEFMSIKEIHMIRDRSESWKAFKEGRIKSTPWFTDEPEMDKKTLLRRAFKSWPKSLTTEALAKAMDLVAEAEVEPQDTEDTSGEREAKKAADLEQIRKYLELLDRPESAFIEHLSRATNRTIDKLEDMTGLEAQQQIIFLEGIIDAQTAKLTKHKSKPKDKPSEEAG